MTRAGARFSRAEPRRRARAFVLGLLAELPRKNCWMIAGHAGDRTPDGMQHLLSRARWDAGGVRDDVRSYVVEQLGDPGAVTLTRTISESDRRLATPLWRAHNAECGRLLAKRDPLACRAQIIRFGAWLGVARSHRRAGLSL